MTSKTIIAAVIGCSLAVLAAGCERQAAKPARSAAASADGGGGSAAGSDRYADNSGAGGAAQGARDDGPTYKDGKPAWASNRRHTSEENIEYQFGKHGSDFGAATADDYVAKVHAFLASPPAGVQTATRTRNGDKIMYDAKSNTFAVVDRRGAPRTMFKPPEGKAYWATAQARLNEPGFGRRGGGDAGGRRGGGSGGGSDDNG